MNNAERSKADVVFFRWKSVEASPNSMNMNALQMEGPAPVASVYIPQKVAVMTDLSTSVFLPPPDSASFLVVLKTSPAINASFV